ncbi:uncharacterized protein LOC112685979 [Sipha flava]|uniref:Uncharacterized protein LOC112685979 n=1 Tax=Sipha flava TaxID=143950 RepID=A0A8B8FU11_9HEMI|nr:uncharacterized protein LOC112685979 [Sipha flava]
MIVPVVNPRDSIVLERDELQKKYSNCIVAKESTAKEPLSVKFENEVLKYHYSKLQGQLDKKKILIQELKNKRYCANRQVVELNNKIKEDERIAHAKYLELLNKSGGDKHRLGLEIRSLKDEIKIININLSTSKSIVNELRSAIEVLTYDSSILNKSNKIGIKAIAENEDLKSELSQIKLKLEPYITMYQKYFKENDRLIKDYQSLNEQFNYERKNSSAKIFEYQKIINEDKHEINNLKVKLKRCEKIMENTNCSIQETKMAKIIESMSSKMLINERELKYNSYYEYV